RAAAGLRQAEGTVIYHVTHAPSLEQGLVREFVRHVRASVQCPARLLTPFSLALALALLCVPLKDHLVLALRKLLVSKRCEARQTAVCELLLCLRHFRVASSLPFSQASQNFSCAMSQVAADLGPAFPTSANEALCLELLGVLRRCLGQQAAVRATLYAGLHEVLSRNPELSESVLAMLLQQLRLYVEQRAGAPPLKLSACLEVGAEEVTLLEPLPELITALAACARRLLAAAADEETEDEGPELLAAREAERALDDIAKDMMNVEVDDFGIGKESEVGGASVDGKRNAVLLHLLQDVYQALLDHRYQTPFEQDEAKATVITCLFEKYSAVADLVKQKAPAKGKKKDAERAKPATGKSRARDPALDPLCLSLRSVTRLLSALTADADPAHHVALERLRGQPALVCHAAEAAPDQHEDLLGWSQQLLRQPPDDEPQFCRQLVELALALSDRCSAHSSLARQLARAVHERLGDLDEETRLAASEVALDAVSERSGELVQAAVPLGPASDAVLRLLGRAYVSLAALVKYYAARSRHGRLNRHTMCAKFERVLEGCGRSLTPHVYTFITFTESQQRQQRQAKRADPAGTRARVLRQTRLIPVLVCNIEQFEKHLIALAQRTKLDLHAGVKLSTSRDFRINQAALQAALERAASSDKASKLSRTSKPAAKKPKVEK
ncbi:Fanconi anemia group I protein-like, partial [Pollicipes pollicipes]|uniref:Fanconi anemia group I protein-like n=1 Tax=Pollicipes pollicipes TaxID=41117 RepID=UPI00188587EF